jgi:hypothetical protein
MTVDFILPNSSSVQISGDLNVNSSAFVIETSSTLNVSNAFTIDSNSILYLSGSNSSVIVGGHLFFLSPSVCKI